MALPLPKITPWWLITMQKFVSSYALFFIEILPLGPRCSTPTLSFCECVHAIKSMLMFLLMCTGSWSCPDGFGTRSVVVFYQNLSCLTPSMTKRHPWFHTSWVFLKHDILIHNMWARPGSHWILHRLQYHKTPQNASIYIVLDCNQLIF